MIVACHFNYGKLTYLMYDHLGAKCQRLTGVMSRPGTMYHTPNIYEKLLYAQEPVEVLKKNKQPGCLQFLYLFSLHKES